MFNPTKVWAMCVSYSFYVTMSKHPKETACEALFWFVISGGLQPFGGAGA